jgi:hypothetical protein
MLRSVAYCNFCIIYTNQGLNYWNFKKSSSVWVKYVNLCWYLCNRSEAIVKYFVHKVHKMNVYTGGPVSSIVSPQVSYVKERNEFSSNFILEGYIRSCQTYLILVHVSLISCNSYSAVNSYKNLYIFSKTAHHTNIWYMTYISLRSKTFILNFLYLVDMWWNTRKIIMTLSDQ